VPAVITPLPPLPASAIETPCGAAPGFVSSLTSTSLGADYIRAADRPGLTQIIESTLGSHGIRV